MVVNPRVHVLLSSACLVAVLGCEGAEPLAPDIGNLEGEWRFAIDPDEVGEEQRWQQPDYDDASWRTLRAPGYWEPQGVTDPRPGQPPRTDPNLRWTDYDGVAWYRLRFVVPAEWRGKPLTLMLGSVDDQDRTFLNGELIGATGPGIERAVLVRRRYEVAAERVRYGEENVLAIRVWDGGGPGGLMGPALTLLPSEELTVSKPLPGWDRPFADRFADPPADCRILKIVHGWPDQEAGREDTVTSLVARGFGGVVSNVSFQGYVEDEGKWDSFLAAMRRAREVNMALWLYDEKGYPSGAAGGIVLRDHPEWEARGLLIADAECSGGEVALDAPPGQLVFAAAYPVHDGRIRTDAAVDLAGFVREGRLAWTAPAGSWRVLLVTEDRLYEGTHAQVSLAEKLPYINLLMPEPTARFIEVTHEQYARRLGPNLGDWFISTFTDEPSLMSCFLRPMPYRVLPWAPNLPEEFARRRGYPLAGVLPLLMVDAPGCEKARHDFWLTIGELVEENFFGQLEAWCEAHGLRSGGHLLIEESLVMHVPFYGDFFRCMRRLTAPSIDCLTSVPAEVPWQIARICSSAADLDGERYTMCETSDHSQRYRPAGDKRPVRVVTEDEIRGTCNRLILGGINTITSYYSFAELSTRQIRALNEWVGRCCAALRGGWQVNDVAVLYPIESLWPSFTPARRGATDAARPKLVEALFDGASEALYSHRRDPAFIDSRTLAEAGVADGALTYRDLRWRVLVLPGVDTLPQAAWRNLARFVAGGGVAIALGGRPRNSESEFPSAEVVALGVELFGAGEAPQTVTNAAGGVAAYLPAGSESLLPAVLDAVLEPEVTVASATSPLRAAHRRIDGREVWFLINDSGAAVEETVTLAAEGPGERLDPATGEIVPVDSAENLSVALGPYRGVLYRFARARQPERRPVSGGAVPGLTELALALPAPTVGKGEFVEAQMTTEADGSWSATGRLTMGQVDTFLFLGFSPPEPLDLSDAAALVVEFETPDGQRTPAELLVILTDGDGGQYLASTGLPIGVPGRHLAYVAFSRFRLAGWSKDPNGVLDRDRLKSISIGWGGYYGQEGETVSFRLYPPRAARLGER